MGNKMKKLICSLLATAMLVTSAGVVSFAADGDADTAEEEATVTEVVDDSSTADQTDEEKESEDAERNEGSNAANTANTADTATSAPAASASASYDDDAYYEKALALCSALGIISGYEDGSVRPESKVTRAEMASIVLRMLAMSATSKYKDIFTDVTTAHWAADQIQSAYEASIINGMGDGTFAPDSEVTYAQVIVMLVNAMNYKQDAEYYGGWQQGYIKEAGELELLKNAPGSADVASDRGVVIKMVYNALLGDYKEVRTYDEFGNPKYEVNSEHPSLAYAKFDVIDAKGVVYGTAKTSIGTKDVQDGQVEIKPEKANDSTLYDTVLTDLEDYLAQKVTYYYRENSGLSPEVLAVTYDSSRSETYVINDIDDIDSISGDFGTGTGKIKINKVSKDKDCTGAIIVYNGKVATQAQINKWATDNGKTANDIVQPEKGTIKLVNSEKNDDVFDVVFIDAYDTVIVQSVSNDRLTGLQWDKTKGIASDATKSYTFKVEDDAILTVSRGGSEARLRNLKKDDVASVKRSLDDSVIDVVVTDETITGTASNISTKVDGSHATVNGTRYEVANVAAGKLKTGTQSTFYLDMFGRIANVESSSPGLLQSGEKYGWVMNVYDSDNQEDAIIQIFTQDGKVEEYKLSNSIDYWEPKANAKSTLDTNIKTTLQNLLADDTKFVRLNGNGTPIRLVKYKANSSGTLSRLYFGVDKTDNPTVKSSTGALILDKTNLKSREAIGGAVAGYTPKDGIVEFTVPNDKANMTNAENFKAGEGKGSTYIVKENGRNSDFSFAEFDGSTPQVVINYASSAKEAAKFSDIDTSGGGPSAMVVKDIDTDMDNDDNKIYTINGYDSGDKVSITTTKNTNLGRISKNVFDNKDIGATTIWQGTDDWELANPGRNPSNALTPAASFDPQKPENWEGITEGDLILYTGDGNVIVQFADAERLGRYVFNGTTDFNYPNVYPVADHYRYGGSRVQYYFGELDESNLSDTAWMSIAGSDIVVDAGKLMDLVVVTKNSDGTISVKIDEEGATIADLISAKDVTDNPNFYKHADYVYVSTANKGDIKDVVVYRFEEK